MKRFNPFNLMLFVLIGIITFFLFSGIAQAGIWGSIKGAVAGQAASVALGAIIGALGIFGLTWKLWGKAVKELGEVIWIIYKAVQPSSEGGKKITTKEMENIINEAKDVYPAVARALASHKKIG